MMRLFHCPRCGDLAREILYIVREKRFTKAGCWECGWSCTFMPPPPEQELGALIEQAVSEAKGT